MVFKERSRNELNRPKKMNYYTSNQNLDHIETELHRLQNEMLEKRRERKHDEVENLEYLIDQLHVKIHHLKRQVHYH